MTAKIRQTVLESVKNESEQSRKRPLEEKEAKGNATGDGRSVRPFTKINFYMMGACLLMIIVGFLLMSGGGSDDPASFNPEIFSTRRIVVGPTIAFLGFLLMAFAIIYTPGKKK